MTKITRRTALAAIPAMAAVTALPALAGATDTDAELFAAIKTLDAALQAHDLADQAASKAHAKTVDLTDGKMTSPDGRMRWSVWEKASKQTGYDPLYGIWCDHGKVCHVASARVFDTPAQTVRGIREKFRLLGLIAVDDDDGARAWQRSPDAWYDSIMRDLDRLVSS